MFLMEKFHITFSAKKMFLFRYPTLNIFLLIYYQPFISHFLLFDHSFWLSSSFLPPLNIFIEAVLSELSQFEPIFSLFRASSPVDNILTSFTNNLILTIGIKNDFIINGNKSHFSSFWILYIWPSTLLSICLYIADRTTMIHTLTDSSY